MDEKDPGFFGFGFDFNNDGNLDDGERINDTAQFMDTFGSSDEENEDEDDDGGVGRPWTDADFRFRAPIDIRKIAAEEEAKKNPGKKPESTSDPDDIFDGIFKDLDEKLKR